MRHVVIATGRWLYDGITPTTVRIVRLDYDFWYAVGDADGDLDADEVPQLNADGYLYYVRQRPGRADDDDEFWPNSQGFATPEAAIAAAEAAIPTTVTWEWTQQPTAEPTSCDGAECATTRARRVRGLSLTDLRRGFRDDAQRRRVQDVIHDRLADDRKQEECRYLMRLWWQLAMPYSEVTIEELRTRVHGTKWEAVEALVNAIRSSPDQVDTWIAATEQAFPIAEDRGFAAEAARLDEGEWHEQASGGRGSALGPE